MTGKRRLRGDDTPVGTGKFLKRKIFFGEIPQVSGPIATRRTKRRAGITLGFPHLKDVR
jgi:hypothetical protein